MQTLWSRAAQAKCTCRCSSCLSSASALSRRTTTATGRRRLRFGDAFTLFYSSIFATAAVADAKRKGDRRRKLDSDIAEVKQELKDLDQRNGRRDKSTEIECFRPRAGNYLDQEKSTWHELLRLRPEDVNDRWTTTKMGLTVLPPALHEQLSQAQIEQILSSDQLLDVLEKGWMAHPSRKGVIRRGHYPPQSTKAERVAGLACPLSPKKLRTLELSVAKLILRFLAQMSSGQGHGLSDGDVLNSRDQIAENSRRELMLKIAETDRYLQMFRQGEEINVASSPRWPACPEYEKNSLSFDGQERLNDTLRMIFQKPVYTRNYDTMLENICNLLLLASSPPNITTYNILIVHLTRLRHNDIVRMVLESLHESHVRPNESTFSAVLNFYTVSNDREGFRGYVRRMYGAFEGGLALARPNIKITAAAEGRVVCRNGKMIQKASENLHVFGSLVHGTLKFFGVKEAMKVYIQMIKDGWEPNIVILTSILRDCQIRRNWQAGFAVWQRIKEVSGYISNRAYLWMLQLCRVCKRQELYEEILQELTRQGVSVNFLQQEPTDKDGFWITDIQVLRKSLGKQRQQAAKASKKVCLVAPEKEICRTKSAGTVTEMEHQAVARDNAPNTEVDPPASTTTQKELREPSLRTRDSEIVSGYKGGEVENRQRWQWPGDLLPVYRPSSVGVTEVQSSL
ncbi:hypothetical protein MMC16_002790 [Acarospora aff. strigata]|nr:hypothetical protein [Acarospora aff. strigata]